MAVKRVLIALGFMLVMCQIGLTLVFLDGDKAYQSKTVLLNKQLELYQSLDRQLKLARAQILQQTNAFDTLQETQYKLDSFCKKYPLFSTIVNTVIAKSAQYGFHPDLVLGIIQVESGFNPYALSNLGAYGLMQVRYVVWKDELHIDKERIFEIEYNIDLGLRILQSYYRSSGGNLKRALFMYNNGYQYSNSGYIDKVAQSQFCQERDLEQLISGAN